MVKTPVKWVEMKKRVEAQRDTIRGSIVCG
jgi:hypothetical protein